MQTKISNAEQANAAPSADTGRCAIYARYSSDMQRESSIEDQIRKCREFAAKQGWVILEPYVRYDQAISGAIYEERESLQGLITEAGQNPRPFDLLLIDSTSRLARNVEDQLLTVKMLKFYDVNVVSVSQGLDSRHGSSRMSFALHGMIDEQFLEDLAKSVHRGQTGRVLTGKYIAGGRCYGYKNVPDEHPTLIGDYGRPLVLGVTRQVVPGEAAVVQRIFTMYGEGFSLDKIAKALRADSVPAPRPPRRNSVRAWSPDGISNILQNEIYIGRYIWNRTTNVRDPKSRRMVTRPTPQSEWKRSERPEWRIVSDELWSRAQEQRSLKRHLGIRRVGGLERTKRSQQYLFSGLLYCGICGGTIRITETDSETVRYGCGAHRDKGACTNAVTIRRDQLEEQLLAWLTRDLLRGKRAQQALTRFYKTLEKRVLDKQNEVRKSAVNAPELLAELAKTTREAENVIAFIMVNGALSPASLQTKLAVLDARGKEIKEQLSRTTAEPVSFSLDEMKEYLLGKLRDINSELTSAPQRGKMVLRKHINKITLTPCAAGGKRALAVTVDFTTGGGDSAVVLTEALEAFRQQYGLSGITVSGPVLDATRVRRKSVPKKGAESDKTPISEAALVQGLAQEGGTLPQEHSA